jgi:hypothetical protein
LADARRELGNLATPGGEIVGGLLTWTSMLEHPHESRAKFGVHRRLIFFERH